MGNRYSDMLSGVVKLTREQRDAVNKVLIRHIGELIWDIPAVDCFIPGVWFESDNYSYRFGPMVKPPADPAKTLRRII